MKIVLLALDGETARAEKKLRARYPQAEIEVLPRAEVERGGALGRLRALRGRAPEAFAVSTERLVWQQGQNALLLFGALAGASRLMLLDAHGGFHEERRGGILWRAPARLAHEAWASAAAVVRARRELKRLERAVETRAINAIAKPRRLETGREMTGARDASNATGATSDDEPHALVITYLRATPAAGTQVGGSTSHINGFINAALDAGARINFISNDRVAGLDETRVTLKIIEPQQLGLTRAAFDVRNSLLFTSRAAGEIENNPPDFIYQRHSRFSWTGVEASLRTGRPLFLEYNGSEVWMGRHWDGTRLVGVLARAERLSLKAAARVFVVAEVERRNLERAGIAPEKIVVNPNGVDGERFRPGVGGAVVRAELDIEEDETLVGFVGTFGPWHGVLTLAEAIASLPKHARMRFLLVGSGSLREKVESLLREAGARERVHFTGAVAHGRVPALLDACDMLASPHVGMDDGSEFFGSPTKLFEYMAMAKGIVASRLGQIAEVLADEETALLVPPGNARALTDALLRLSESRELRERLGTRARAACLARYTWKHNAARVLDAYRALPNFS